MQVLAVARRVLLFVHDLSTLKHTTRHYTNCYHAQHLVFVTASDLSSPWPLLHSRMWHQDRPSPTRILEGALLLHAKSRRVCC